VKLKTWLKKNKMTQAQFAKLVGCDQPHVSDLMNGKVTPGVRTIIKIAEATDNDVTYDDWIKERLEAGRTKYTKEKTR